MSVINLTPHAITYINNDGDNIVIPSSGVARATATTETVGSIDGFRLTKSCFGDPVNLPDYQEGVYLVVSVTTANAARQAGRRLDDLLTTNETVRDNSGAIIGCRSFAVVE